MTSTEADDVAALYVGQRLKLVRLAAAITLNVATAEEVVQEAFLGLQRHRSRVVDVQGYLHRSVVNLSVSVVRRRKVAARHALAPPPPASNPEIEEIWASVSRLPARQRAVVVLRFWDDQTVESIALTLGWPAGSVKSTLHRALRSLKEDLNG
jgi:RNA polymerase sigma factor (sigma-70 family)